MLRHFSNARLALSLSKLASLVFSRLAPDWAYKKVEHQLLTPKSRRIDLTALPHGISALKLDTRHGLLQTYQVGKGPAVVLLHGWNGGAYQFFPLMRGLSQCGFKAIAIDHFGHGHSHGTRSSLARIITSTNMLLKYVSDNVEDGLAGIVAHSLGCVALANAHPKLVGDTPLMLVAPVHNQRRYFANQIHVPGLHPSVEAKYRKRIALNSHIDSKHQDIAQSLQRYADQAVIVHDRDDKTSNFAESVKFCSKHPLTQLNITRGLGHDRIIQSESVWHQLKAMLNYEDITTNPFPNR